MKASRNTNIAAASGAALIALLMVGMANAYALGFWMKQSPLDADIIEKFQSDHTEFDFWNNKFSAPEMVCNIQLFANGLKYENPDTCAISDETRLIRFMQKNKIHGAGSARGGASFELFGNGGLKVAHSKFIIFGDVRPFEPGAALVDSTDDYDLVRREKIKEELLQGVWYREIEDDWYILYIAFL